MHPLPLSHKGTILNFIKHLSASNQLYEAEFLDP